MLPQTDSLVKKFQVTHFNSQVHGVTVQCQAIVVEGAIEVRCMLGIIFCIGSLIGAILSIQRSCRPCYEIFIGRHLLRMRGYHEYLLIRLGILPIRVCGLDGVSIMGIQQIISLYLLLVAFPCRLFYSVGILFDVYIRGDAFKKFTGYDMMSGKLGDVNDSIGKDILRLIRHISR